MLLSFLFLSLTLAQSFAGAEPARFSAESRVVLVPVTVMNRQGSVVTGLTAGSFTLTQDNVPQRITSFGEEDIPASIGVVFDTSGSMHQALPQAKSMLRAFFDQCNPEDEAFLYTVSTRPDLDSAFTNDFGSMLGHSAFFEARGATALVDTVYAAVQKMRSAHNSRKALLVISDGMDNHSRYSKAELMSLAVEADVQIFSISVFDPPRNKKPIELQEERQGVFFLEDISRRTGGLQMVVQNEHEIGKAAATIGKAIRMQYLIGYIPDATPPAASNTGRNWHSIRVRTTLPNTVAWARAGYFAEKR